MYIDTYIYIHIYIYIYIHTHTHMDLPGKAWRREQLSKAHSASPRPQRVLAARVWAGKMAVSPSKIGI